MVREVDHNCGVVLASSLHDVYKMMEALQHRGRDGAGIAMQRHDGSIDAIRWLGPVSRLDLLHGPLVDETLYHT